MNGVTDQIERNNGSDQTDETDQKENGIGLENHGFGLEYDTENGVTGGVTTEKTT